MVGNLKQAFERRIDALTWMSPETKSNAKRKLATLRVGIGYPDRWRDFSGLRIVRGDAAGNAERASLFRYQSQIAKLGKPVDPDEWWMTPQTVNAVNLPLQNGLNFPAARLQPPFFEPHGDPARNYGSQGVVIGHEISHSFDDVGSQFDARGRLVNWFTKADLERFESACESLAAQFDKYRPFPDLAINGRQTLSKNVADLAGLLAAYDAYRLSLQGKPDVTRLGFPVTSGSSWDSRSHGAQILVKLPCAGLSRQTATRRPCIALMRLGTSMPGTPHLTSCRARSSTSRPPSVFVSGNELPLTEIYRNFLNKPPSGSKNSSTTRSFSGIIALSVIVICSGHTFVQHFVMLHKPIP